MGNYFYNTPIKSIKHFFILSTLLLTISLSLSPQLFKSTLSEVLDRNVKMT